MCIEDGFDPGLHRLTFKIQGGMNNKNGSEKNVRNKTFFQSDYLMSVEITYFINYYIPEN